MIPLIMTLYQLLLHRLCRRYHLRSKLLVTESVIQRGESCFLGEGRKDQSISHGKFFTKWFLILTFSSFGSSYSNYGHRFSSSPLLCWSFLVNWTVNMYMIIVLPMILRLLVGMRKNILEESTWIKSSRYCLTSFTNGYFSIHFWLTFDFEPVLV